MNSKKITVNDIEKCLPQTQCGLCDYPGCKPYAEAILKGEAQIDHCHPGGEKTLTMLADLLDVDADQSRDKVLQQYETRKVVVIDKETCIGCTKCLPPCPVDAIVGMRKQMHTVIAEVCTGCGLCIEPCPMDCISLVESPLPILEPWTEQYADNNKQRYEKHNQRLAERQKNKFAPIKR